MRQEGLRKGGRYGTTLPGAMMKRLPFLIVIVLLLSLFPGRPHPAAGGPKAPPFSLVSLDGKRFTQDDMIGKATLVIFWASWCGTCRHELPKAHRLQAAMAGRPFQIIAVGFQDEPANIRRYAASHPDIFTFPVFYDRGNRMAARFGARVTPTLFLFDKSGELVVPYRGGGLFDHPKFKETLEAIL